MLYEWVLLDIVVGAGFLVGNIPSYQAYRLPLADGLSVRNIGVPIMNSRFTALLVILGAISVGGCDTSEDLQGQAEPLRTTPPPAALGSEAIDATATGKPLTRNDAMADGDARTIEWDVLIPEDWRPETLMAAYDTENLSDDDPRAQELLDKLTTLWKEAPIVPALAGQRVRLPGFVVPLEMDEKKIGQFLLVPYYGACIHTPPPPANQTVHVVIRENDVFQGQLFDVVWVTGTMRIERLSSELAEAGYRLEDASVAPYE